MLRSRVLWMLVIAVAPFAIAETITLENKARPVSALPLPAPLSAELESITIDNAIRLHEDKVYVRVALPFDITAQWRARSFGLSDVACYARIQGAGPDIEVPLGTLSPSGEDFAMSASIDIPRFTHVGDGVLTVGVTVDRDGEEQRVALGAWKIHAVPIIITSRSGDDALSHVFGQDFVDTRASFRLGPGARISIPLPKGRGASRGIGIVSTLNYGNVGQGARVVSVTPVFTDGSMGTAAYIEAGVHTALEQYDKLPPGTHRSKKIDIFESTDSGADLDWRLRSYQRHKYVAEVGLTIGQEVERLEVRYERDEGMIDIDALVLLAGAP